jgi:quercetin dioxygenase-like cupin family protein
MSSDDRLRPHPHERLNAPAQRIALAQAARDLRGEDHPPVDGHRQIVLAREGPVSVVLFAFEKGAALKEHRAPGAITIHTLAGHIRVTTGEAIHDLPAGSLLALAAGVPHDVSALDRSDMLLTVTRA